MRLQTQRPYWLKINLPTPIGESEGSGCFGHAPRKGVGAFSIRLFRIPIEIATHKCFAKYFHNLHKCLSPSPHTFEVRWCWCAGNSHSRTRWGSEPLSLSEEFLQRNLARKGNLNVNPLRFCTCEDLIVNFNVSKYSWIKGHSIAFFRLFCQVWLFFRCNSLVSSP